MAYRDTKSFNYSSDEDSFSDASSSDHDNETSWKRQKHDHPSVQQEVMKKPCPEDEKTKTQIREGEKLQSKRVNKVWASVLQGQEEQAVEFQMSNFDMDPFSSMAERDVEAYNYRHARDSEAGKDGGQHRHGRGREHREYDHHHHHHHHHRHHHHPDDERHGSHSHHYHDHKSDRHLKRKRSAKERLGKRSAKDRLGNSHHSVKDRLGKRYCDTPIEVNELHDPETIAREIIKRLEEQKEDLIRKIVEVLGNKKALQLLRETEEVERTGGMMTKDGARRRHPGGVFLSILKSDTDVTKEQLDEINKCSRQMENQHKRKAEKRRRYLKAKRFKQQMQNIDKDTHEVRKKDGDEEMESGEIKDEEMRDKTGIKKEVMEDFRVEREVGEIKDDEDVKDGENVKFQSHKYDNKDIAGSTGIKKEEFEDFEIKRETGEVAEEM
ncbi:phosphorylated adapter RNA export protein-like [Glandiceps talaboti]